MLELILELHRRRNHRPIVETVRQLLHATRAHAGFAMRPAGNQVLANVERVLDLARGYELSGGRSFRGFVERLESEARSPRSSQPVVVEEGAPGVRLMTVHNAKGLEFPVVVLADMTANLATRDPDRTLVPERGMCASRLLGWTPRDLLERADIEHERDESEGVRVAYVAATRARDLLVVPGVGDQALDGWLSPLNKAIYPTAGAWRRSSTAAGCPPFGERSVCERPVELEDGIESSVRPGAHRLGTDDHPYDVVWWDPNVLDLSIANRFGLRQETLLSEDEGGTVAARNLERYRSWREAEEVLRQHASAPSVEITRVTDLEVPPPRVAAVRWLAVERDVQRPQGARFGTLVHTVLQLCDSDDDAHVTELVGLHGRLLQATSLEVEAAVTAVRAAYAHDLLRAARESPRRCREMPFSLPLERPAASPTAAGEDGGARRVVEGSIDLAFLDQGRTRWTVVDYKTDLDVSADAERYERQVAWYCYALERLTGIPAEGCLLAV